MWALNDGSGLDIQRERWPSHEQGSGKNDYAEIQCLRGAQPARHQDLCTQEGIGQHIRSSKITGWGWLQIWLKG